MSITTDINVSKEMLIMCLRQAINDTKKDIDFRNLVLGFYEGEKKYSFDNEIMETTFGLIASNIEYIESYNDKDWEADKLRLLYVLKTGQTVEAVICALEYESIKIIRKKLSDGFIDDGTYYDQIQKLAPLSFSVNKMMNFYNENATSLEDIEYMREIAKIN